MMTFIFKMMNLVLNIMNFAVELRCGGRRSGIDFIQIDEFCITNDEFCISNDDCFYKRAGLLHCRRSLPLGPVAQHAGESAHAAVRNDARSG